MRDSFRLMLVVWLTAVAAVVFTFVYFIVEPDSWWLLLVIPVWLVLPAQIDRIVLRRRDRRPD